MKKILLILLFLISGCSLKNEEIINPIVNSNQLIIEEQNINNLTFKNVSLSYQNGISTFIVSVVNNNNEVVSFKEILVKFKNKNGKEIITLNGALGNIDIGGTIEVNITSDIDLSEAYSLEYILK